MAMLGLNGAVSAENAARYTDLDVAGFANYLGDKKVQLVDVRTPEEYSQGHIAGARNIDFYDKSFVTEAVKALDKSRPVAVYCRSGKRSAAAAGQLVAKGYKVVNLKGGVIAWTKDKMPLEK